MVMVWLAGLVRLTPPDSWPPLRRVRVKLWVPVPLLVRFQLTVPWSTVLSPTFWAAAYRASVTVRLVTLVMSAPLIFRVLPLVSTVRFRFKLLMV